jgi:hypothetical protein
MKNAILAAIAKDVARFYSDRPADEQLRIAAELNRHSLWQHLNADGSLPLSIAGTSVTQELFELVQRGGLDEILATQAATPTAVVTPPKDATIYPGGRSRAEVQAIRDPVERMSIHAEGTGMEKSGVGRESWRRDNSIAPFAGLDQAAASKLTPEEKLNAANMALFQKLEAHKK